MGCFSHLFTGFGRHGPGFVEFKPENTHGAISVRDGFLFVTLFWLILSVTGSLPFILGLHLGFTDRIFESVSGFTTTGSTVIGQLDQLPPSILYHRQQIQWLGGIGIIVLAVAVLPLLGVGGMQLYRAEASGVARHERMTPRIVQTARAFWLIYFLLTLVCALAYWAAGMKLFDAVRHLFSTIATGGFSTHDASLAFYNSGLIESIAVVFMLAGGGELCNPFHSPATPNHYTVYLRTRSCQLWSHLFGRSRVGFPDPVCRGQLSRPLAIHSSWRLPGVSLLTAPDWRLLFPSGRHMSPSCW